MRQKDKTFPFFRDDVQHPEKIDDFLIKNTKAINLLVDTFLLCIPLNHFQGSQR